MTPTKARTIAAYLLLSVFVAGIFGALMESLFLLIVTGALFLAFNGCLLLFWRCQACRRLLPPVRLWGMAYCPYCGEKLK